MKKKINTSTSAEYPTPRWFLNKLAEQYGPFDLDPCCTVESACAPAFYTKDDDGLAQDWFGIVYMNPPYGKELPKWMAKAWAESLRPAVSRVVCLIPSRTDTAWWHDNVEAALERGQATYWFLRGRLQFAGNRASGGSAPFPSAVVVFENRL